MDEDEVVKQLMSMLGNKKQLQIKSADGKTIKLSVDFLLDHEDSSIDNNLENELNIINTSKDSTPCRRQDEE
jgi:hypothetical protein